MPRSTATIILGIVIILALAGLVGWYLFLSPAQDTGSDDGFIDNVFSGFFPAGRGTETPRGSIDGNQASTTDEVEDPNQPAPAIRKIAADPTAGFGVLLDAKKVPTVRYMESATGHTWNAPLTILGKTRLTNTTIPKVREAIWLPGGNQAVARYVDDESVIQSFSGTLKPEKTDAGTILGGPFEGVFLPADAVSLVASPSTAKIFYLLENESGATGITINPDGKNPTRIFNSSIREWLPSWGSVGTIYLGTKPSSGVPGYLASINPANGAETRVLGGIPGLVAKGNQNNSAILYSSGNNNDFKLFVYDVKLKKSEEQTLSTLADKCAWDPTNANVFYCGIPSEIPQGSYPDSWYQGVVSFSDDIWKIDRKTGEVLLVGYFKAVTNEIIDVENPQVSPDGAYFVFINKNNRSLWSVKTDTGTRD